MLTHPNFADNLTPVPPPQRLHYFWERQCDISPDAIALICEQEQLTWLSSVATGYNRYSARNYQAIN